MNKVPCRMLMSWVRAYCFPPLLGLLLIAPCQAQSRLPQTPAEWRAFDQQLFDLYKARDYERVAAAERLYGAQLLSSDNGHYTPNVCIALSLNRLGHIEEALPYFEKALASKFKEDVLYDYFAALFTLNEIGRSVDFFQRLGQLYPEQQNFVRPYQTFFGALNAGDKAYLSGDKSAALMYYQEAMRAYQNIPVTREVQDKYIAGMKNNWDEYTYEHLYDVPDGYKRRKLLDAAFLKPKLQICQATLPDNHPVICKWAALVVRNTDVSYNDRGRPRMQQSHLDDAKLAVYKQAWQFAMGAVYTYTQGKFKVETTWIDLPNVTVKGLHDEKWHGLFTVRWLDPQQLEPAQDELFKQVVAQYDGVVFVWDRGKAASAYGSGARSLPYHEGELPKRGLTKSMPGNSTDCLHEFLHSMYAATGLSPHGLPGDWAKVAPGYKARNVTDQVDWYTYILSAAKHWSRATYRKADNTTVPPDVGQAPEPTMQPDVDLNQGE